MDAKSWKKKITKQVKDIGTYRPEFSSAIEALSEILSQRDVAYTNFLDSGGEPCIIKTSDRGAQNVSKNPRLQIWMDLNAQALSYWRDLGLTPAGLKRLNENSMKITPEKKTMESVLAGLEI